MRSEIRTSTAIPAEVEDNSGQPQTYCQQSFPYIGGNQELGSSYKLRLTGGNFENAVNPLIIDTDAWVQINGSRLGAYAFNIRPFAYNGAPYMDSFPGRITLMEIAISLRPRRAPQAGGTMTISCLMLLTVLPLMGLALRSLTVC